MNINRVRAERIIEILRNAPMSGKELKEELGLNRDAFRRAVTEAGTLLEITNESIKLDQKKYQIVSGQEEGKKESRNVEQLDIRSLKKAMILKLMSETGPVTLSELTSHYMKRFYGDGEIRDRALIKKSRDMLYHILQKDGTHVTSLLTDGLVTVNEQNDEAVYDLTAKAPVFVRLRQPGSENDDGTFDDVLNAIQSYGGESAVKETLGAIANEMSFIMEAESYENRVLKRTGRRTEMSGKSAGLIRELSEKGFTERAVRVPYRGRKGNAKKVDIKAGLLLYASDKNEMYLLGKSARNGSRDIILRFSRITGPIEEMEEEIPNDIFCSPAYLEMYEQMFSVSTEQPFEVEVEFNNVFSVAEKLKRAVSLRKNAHLEERVSEDGRKYIIYTDTVRGLEDVAKFIRSFGSAHVIKPMELRDRITSSIEETLEAYAREGYDV